MTISKLLEFYSLDVARSLRRHLFGVSENITVIKNHGDIEVRDGTVIFNVHPNRFGGVGGARLLLHEVAHLIDAKPEELSLPNLGLPRFSTDATNEQIFREAT